MDVLRPGLGERSYRDGEFLIRQGEQSTHLFYLLEGQVEVLLKLPPHVIPTPTVASAPPPLCPLHLCEQP